MRKSNREVNGEKVFRYSIRKYHFGAASVAVAALMFFANGAVRADTLPVSPATANTEKVNVGVTELTEGVPLEKSLETERNKEVVAPESVEKTSNKEDGAGSSAQVAKEIKVSDKAVIPANQTEKINKSETNGKEKEAVTNKDKLESLLKEIDQLNLKDYTEDSVKVLQEKVAKAKEVLVNATTQKEIDLAYNALVGYKNAGLKRVPKPKGELTPKPDTTNGKATVGKKAENTEPNGTNIAGHNHSLNGTALPEGSGFRATPEEVAGIEFGISNGQRDGNYSRTDRYFDTLSSNQYTRIFKFVSKSGNINSVTATSSAGRSVTLEKMDKFPNNATTYFVKAKTDVTGVSDAILSFTVKTAGGDKTAQIGVYRSLGKPTIKVPTGQKESTVDEYLKGKQKTTPTIDVEVPVVPNLPSYAKMKVYLVHDNDRDKGVYDGDEWAENHNPRPTRLTAKVEVPYGRVNPKTNKTTVTIQSSDYLKPLEEGKYFALSVIEINNEMNTNPGIRASSFSDAATVAPNIDKAAAVSAIDAKVTEKNGQIDRDTTLTTEEKTAQKGSVTSEANKAKTAINNATTNAAVETAKTNGLNAIGSVTTANKVKAAAKAELATIAAEEIKAIKADASLPASEQAKKEAEVNTKKADGEREIDKAETTDKVAQAKATAKTAIEGVHTPGDLAEVKRQAKAALEEAAKAEKSEIASDNSVTSADRVTQTNAVDTKKTEAEGNITSAVDADAVAAAKTAGEAAIRGVHNNGDLESLKTAAKAALEEAAKAEKSEIASDNSVTSADRVTQTNAVDTKKTEAEGQITSAVDADAVATAKTAGVAAIKAVHTVGSLDDVKAAAKAELATAAAEEKAEIADDKSLTAAQRAEKEKAVDDTKAAEEAKITAADDADKVATAKTAGVAAIKAVHTAGDLNAVKNAAKALPNTGTVKSTLAIPVAITSALLSLGLVGGRRRKEDEEV